MNIVILVGLILAGSTIAFEHLVNELPQWLAILLYSVAVVLFLIGMIKSRSNERSSTKKVSKNSRKP